MTHDEQTLIPQITVGRITRQVDHASSNTVTWRALCERQLDLLHDNASHLLWSGLASGIIHPHVFPDRDVISARLEERTGWRLIRAQSRYLTDEQWFTALARKEFPVTDFIRAPHEIDFTPEPDLFHDFFGHLPQMTHPRIAQIAHQFGLAFVATEDPQRRESIGRLWWHTLEFGMLAERGRVVTLGAGLWSSKEELLHCKDPKRWRPFDLWKITQTPKAVENVHSHFFVLDSLEQLEHALEALTSPLVTPR